VKPCGINVAMLRAEKAWRAVLASEKLSDIVAGFMNDADPRSVAAACAFVERYQRPQKSSSLKRQERK
jgi:DNA-binding IscR family transcriptional regulator